MIHETVTGREISIGNNTKCKPSNFVTNHYCILHLDYTNVNWTRIHISIRKSNRLKPDRIFAYVNYSRKIKCQTTIVRDSDSSGTMPYAIGWFSHAQMSSSVLERSPNVFWVQILKCFSISFQHFKNI